MADQRSRSRRRFLKTFAIAGAGISLGPSARGGIPEGDTGAGPPPPDRVPRRPLGRSGRDVPILILGGGERFDPRYDKILHRAFAAGVDSIDTGLVYSAGLSHKTLAPFLEQVGRENLWITSKGHCDRASVGSFTRDLDACLRQLETDYLDLFLMQALEDPKYLEPEYLRMGRRMRESGKTRLFGFSTCGGSVVRCMEKAARVGGIDAIMFRYNFSHYGNLALNRAIDACCEAGIGLIAMKSQYAVPDDDERVRGFRSKDFTLAQAKLKAVWADERIAAVTSSMDNTRKLAENIAAARSPVQLSMGDLQQLRRIATAGAPYACQGCAEICEPLVEGPLKVARPLRYLMYHECYGEAEHARAMYRRLSRDERAFEDVDLRAATAACPQRIDIASRLAAARRALEETA